MYFPYLRGKRNEFLALLDLKEKIVEKETIIPIVEVVRKKNEDKLSNENYFYKLLDDSISFVIPINPTKGMGNIEDIINLIFDLKQKSNNFYIGINITQNLNYDKLDYFLKLFKDMKFVLIHHWQISYEVLKIILSEYEVNFNVAYIDNLSEEYTNYLKNISNCIALTDGFKKKNRNRDYPYVSFFSDLVLNYKVKGFKGIGDFLTIGDTFSLDGGPAHSVAIHITALENDSLNVYHFVSDDKEGVENREEKFLQALNHAVKYINDSEIELTMGVHELLYYHENQHFPQLGPIKKASIKHHIELITNTI